MSDTVSDPGPTALTAWRLHDDGTWSATTAVSAGPDTDHADALEIVVEGFDLDPAGFSRGAEQALIHAVFQHLSRLLEDQVDAQWLASWERDGRSGFLFGLPDRSPWRRWLDAAAAVAPAHTWTGELHPGEARARWEALAPPPEAFDAAQETRRLEDQVAEGLADGDRLDRPRDIALTLGFRDADARSACAARLGDWDLDLVDLGAGDDVHPLGLTVSCHTSPLDLLARHATFLVWLHEREGAWLGADYEPVLEAAHRGEDEEAEEEDPFQPDLRLLRGDPGRVEWAHELHVATEDDQRDCAELLTRLGFAVELGPPPPDDLPTVGAVWSLTATREDLGVLLPSVVWDLHDLARFHGGRWRQGNRLDVIEDLMEAPVPSAPDALMATHMANVDRALGKALDPEPAHIEPPELLGDGLLAVLVSIPFPGTSHLARGHVTTGWAALLGIVLTVVLLHVGYLIVPSHAWFLGLLAPGALAGVHASRQPTLGASGCGVRLLHGLAAWAVLYAALNLAHATIVHPMRVPDDAMTPAIQPGEPLVVPTGLFSRAPTVGDIAVVRWGPRFRIGRVLGRAGDTVVVDPSGAARRNGQPLQIDTPAPPLQWWEAAGEARWLVTRARPTDIEAHEVSQGVQVTLAAGELLLAPDVRGMRAAFVAREADLVGVVR